MYYTVENYEEDITNNEIVTGIKEGRIFNKLINFHVIVNSALDSMYDTNERIRFTIYIIV